MNGSIGILYLYLSEKICDCVFVCQRLKNAIRGCHERCSKGKLERSNPTKCVCYCAVQIVGCQPASIIFCWILYLFNCPLYK